MPDGKPVAAALKRITHLGIGAHQDDLEFMAFHGILASYLSKTKWFGGVTCTNGSGSARAGKFKNFSDEQMMVVRRREQNRAAKLAARRLRSESFEQPGPETDRIHLTFCNVADLNLRMDVRAIVSRLPIHLRILARQLSEMDLADVRRQAGRSRSTVHQWVAEIRSAFIDAGMAPANRGGAR